MRPSAPCPPPPRPFRLGAIDASTLFLLLFGALWTLAGSVLAVFLALTGGPVLGDFTLDRRGVATQAIPVSVEPTSMHVSGRPVHRITYSFSDRAGVLHLASVASSDAGLVERARRHVPLGIEYDPTEPTLTRPKGASASPFGLLVLLPLAFVLVGGAILMIAVHRALGVREIYVHGQAVPATVTAVAPSNLRVSHRRVMRVEYVFETPRMRVTGQATTVHPPAVGAKIWVIHLPAEPEKNVAA